MTSTKESEEVEVNEVAVPTPEEEAAALNEAESMKLGTYVQLTDDNAEVPRALWTIVEVGRLARDERISVAAYQEVLDALWHFGPIDASKITGAVEPEAPVAKKTTAKK